MSLLSGGQAPMTDEAGGGTGDVETEKNSKDSGPLAAGRRHQEGCLCRKGTRVEGSQKCGPGDGCRVRLSLTKNTLTARVLGEWNCLPALQHGAPLVLEILEQRLDGQPSWSLWGKWLPGGR